MTFVLSRPVADRLALGSIAILVACAAGCQSDVADQQSSSSTTPTGQSQGKGGGASTSNSSSNDQGGADGSGNSKDQGGERATSDTSDSDAGGSSSTDSERGGTGQGGASSSASNRGGAANGGSSSITQGATATGGRSSRTSGVGGRTQLGSSTGGRSAGGQATGGKSQAGEATGGRTQSGSATGGRAPGGSGAGGSAAGGSSTGGGNTGGSKASSTSASSAPNADAQAYVDATNEVRAAVTAPANYSGTWVPLPNVTWSDEVAASAQQWVNHLRDAENCGLVHEQNTGLGENLAMGTRLTPAGAVQLWAGEKSKFTYSSPFSYTAAAGHYTQLVWRTSIQIGCASATCGNSVVISCRYKPPGNVIGGKIY